MGIDRHIGFQESEEGYRLLFDANPQPMWIYDRDALTFLAVNDAAIHQYGYSREEFLRMTLKDIRPPEDVPSLLEKVSQVKPGMNSASGRHLKKNGALINVEIVSHTLQFDDRRAELVLVMDVRNGNPKFPSRENAIATPDEGTAAFEHRKLTATEKRIARSVARGFSNKQIANILGISVRTVENHISHILLKKGFDNRVQIARDVLQDNS